MLFFVISKRFHPGKCLCQGIYLLLFLFQLLFFREYFLKLYRNRFGVLLHHFQIKPLASCQDRILFPDLFLNTAGIEFCGIERDLPVDLFKELLLLFLRRPYDLHIRALHSFAEQNTDGGRIRLG